MTKREQDLHSAQRAFDALRPEEKWLIADALHDEWNLDRLESDQWTWATLLRRLQSEIDASLKKVGQLREDLEKDPVRALYWAENVVEAATLAEVYTEALRALESRGPDVVEKHYRQKLISRATCPSRSTNVMANTVEAGRTSAVARLLDALRWL